MALKMTLEKNVKFISTEEFIEDEIEKIIKIKNCYFKVTSIAGNKEKINFCVTGYSDYENGKIVYKKSFNFIPVVTENSENFIKQAYEYLKKLEEFAGAEDC